MGNVIDRSFIAGILLTLLLAPAGAYGQAPTSPTVAALHIVRPGETLRQIAQRFLGSSELWPEIHRLNPGIANPDQIEPGERVRIPNLKSLLPAARLSRLSREVEDQPSPIGWGTAQLGDVLVERDGVRTRRKSSAEMQFLDGARLTVTEDSLVFLRRSGAVLRGVERKSIEIVEGQADLEARAASASASAPEVEIVVGNARATSRADRSGPAQTRARRSEGGGAKLMAYGGESEVEAGGAKVQVPRGMGTSVASAGPPSPPEKLLAAPRLAAPADGAEMACADPLLSWEPLTGAATYTVEVCRDPGCAELIDRRTGESAAEWRPAALPTGSLYWRVTARGASGLDGYPSEASRLAVTSDQAGLTPPTGSLQVTGPQVRVGDRLFVSSAARVEATTLDSTGSPARWKPLIGGKEEAAWPSSWTAGEQTAGAIALDGCGNRGTIAPIVFMVDTAAPTIRWEVGDQEALKDRLAPDDERERRRLRGHRDNGRASRDAWPSLAGVWLVPVPWARAEEMARVARFPVEIASDHPQAFFSAPRTDVIVEGSEGTLSEERFLWVAADDAGAGVDRLTFRTRPDGDNMVLEVEASDLVGNVSKRDIVLRRGAEAPRGGAKRK
jgi:hypothetical protein